MAKHPHKANVSNMFLESLIKSNNATALKIMFYVARSDLVVPDTRVLDFKIDTKKLCDYCNIDSKTLIRNIETIQETTVKYRDDKGMGFINLIVKSHFGYNEGVTEITMLKEVLDKLIEVKQNFTTIDVQNIMKLTSKHSLKMIQLLERINGYSEGIAKRKEFTLDELNKLFGVKYKRLKEFERKILVPAKNELDLNSKLSFVYSIKYDKEKMTKGRAKAVSATIDLIANTPYPTLF